MLGIFDAYHLLMQLLAGANAREDDVQRGEGAGCRAALTHRPRLKAVGPHEAAVLLQNVQNWTVRNLELTQHGQTPQALDANNEHGKDADQYSDEYMRAVVHVLGLGRPNDSNCEGCTVRNIRLENLVVHDGSWNGIYASGGYYQLRTDTYGVVDNLVIEGQARHLGLLRRANGDRLIVVARNNDRVQVLRPGVQPR